MGLVGFHQGLLRGIVEQSDLSFTSGFFFRMAFIAIKNLPRTIYRYMNIYIYIYRVVFSLQESL